MGTIQNFVTKHAITMTSDYTSHNPHMDDSDNMNHFKVKITIRVDGKRRQYTTYFSMGLGLKGDPAVEDVLDCLASDASSADNARDFEDWASDFGYGTDSPKAERTYKIVVRQSKRLKHLLGETAYTDLLWSIERL